MEHKEVKVKVKVKWISGEEMFAGNLIKDNVLLV